MAANITGIAKKNENSVATWRDKPKDMPPRMVAPERETPGIKASDCANPIFTACQLLISSMLWVRALSANFSISKIEIFYGYGAQCFPRDGVYARSEKFIFEKLEDGNFELATYQKLWNISRQNATKFSKNSSITNLSRKCNSKILLDLIKNLNADKQNFSFTFLKAKIKKPSKRRIIKLSKKMDNFYKVDCYDFFDCEYRNEIIDSIQNFEHFDKYVSSIKFLNMIRFKIRKTN